MKQPIIGITLDYSTHPTYSPYPWYALREHYITAVEKMGGIPLLIPYVHSHISTYLDRIDGLLIPGGDADIHPRFYGQSECHPLVVAQDNRAEFEMELMRAALKKELPFLGICGGLQILNVVLGGTLIQHIPDYVSGKINHKQSQPRPQPSHKIILKEDTLLHHFLKKDTLVVNSWHHQSTEKPGQGLVVNALAEDGVIEGIEVSDHRFCLGVQWHPEYLSTASDQILFKAFLKACTL